MKLKSAFTMRQKALEVSTDSLLPGEDSNVHLVHWLADSLPVGICLTIQSTRS